MKRRRAWPTGTVAQQVEGAGARMAARGKAAGKRKVRLGRALVVEDDVLLAMQLEDALNDGGAEEVTVCGSVAAAMVELERMKPDILILDVHLADRDDGWAMAELVVQLSPKPPVIVFSTATPEIIPARIASLGAVMGKPYQTEALIATLQRHRRRPGLLARLRKALAINGQGAPTRSA